MLSDYTPRKEDETFALPPVPGALLWAGHCDIARAYGHACAEAARAPLAEENARLLARIAELEAENQTLTRECSNAEDESGRLEEELQKEQDEVNRLRAEVEALRSGIERALTRARVFDDGSDGADGESARSCVEILSALIDAARKGEGSEG